MELQSCVAQVRDVLLLQMHFQNSGGTKSGLHALLHFSFAAARRTSSSEKNMRGNRQWRTQIMRKLHCTDRTNSPLYPLLPESFRTLIAINNIPIHAFQTATVHPSAFSELTDLTPITCAQVRLTMMSGQIFFSRLLEPNPRGPCAEPESKAHGRLATRGWKSPQHAAGWPGRWARVRPFGDR